MAHGLENAKSMIYVGETPWHGLGIRLNSPPPTIEDALILAGMDWTVEKRPLFTLAGSGPVVEGGDLECQDVPGHFAVCRNSDSRVLGVVGADYTPLQNTEAFGHLNDFLLDGKAAVETAGQLRGGATVWMLLKLKTCFEVIPGDEVASYLLATTAHDGSRVYQHRYTPIRVVCQNTLSAAAPKRETKENAAKGAAFKRRHTVNALSSITEASKILMAVHDSAVATQEVFQAMAKKQMTRQTMNEFLKELVPDNADAKRTTRTSNIRDEIMKFVDGGVGTDIKGVRGSLWGLYNGVTEWLDHSRGTDGGHVEASKADSRLYNLWFGSGQQVRDRAFELAVASL